MKRVRLQHRPSKRSSFLGVTQTLTEELIAQIAEKIRSGLPLDATLDLLGIRIGTYWRWYKRGDLYERGNSQPEEDWIYGFFRAEVKRAFALFKEERVLRLKTRRDWVREMVILERRDRKNWGKHDPQGGSDEDYDPDERFL